MSDKRVLCVGLTCLDMIQTVQKYPKEDSDQRSIEARWQRGGNASNNCTVLSQLEVKCEFLGTLGEDLTLEFLQNDFKRLNIATDHCPIVSQGTCPISNVLLSAETGSRTIVHHQGSIPEINIEQFSKLDISKYSWVHFEGRNVDGVSKMLQYIENVKDSNLKTSIELEKPRHEQNILLSLPDLVFLGKDYAEYRGWRSAEASVEAAVLETKPGASVVCGWGALGAWAQQGVHGPLLHSPAFSPTTVVDSLGAGDTFVAATIASLTYGYSLEHAIHLACKLAGSKVGQKGFEELSTTWKTALKEVPNLEINNMAQK